LVLYCQGFKQLLKTIQFYICKAREDLEVSFEAVRFFVEVTWPPNNATTLALVVSSSP
jgi:hypothetical protein